MKIKGKLIAFAMIIVCFILVKPIVVKAEEEPIGPIDVRSITKYVEQDNWSYDPATKTLTLAGVNIDGYASSGYSYSEDPDNQALGPFKIYEVFDLYPGTTIIVKEGTVNNIIARFSGSCFRCTLEAGEKYEPITIKGGGTLNIKYAQVAFYSYVDVNISDVTINFSDGDIFAMTFSDEMEGYEVKNSDGTVTKKYRYVTDKTTLTATNCNINVEGCTGGFYGYGAYPSLSYIENDRYDIEESKKLPPCSFYFKNTNLKMEVVKDYSGERNHSAFLVRNGNLTFEDCSLDLNTYQGSIVAWRMYHTNEKQDQVVKFIDCVLPNDVEVAGSKVDYSDKSDLYVYGETVVEKGKSTSLSFDLNDKDSFDFGGVFENALKSLKVSHAPRVSVSFNTGATSKINPMSIIKGKAIGKLPTCSEEGRVFLGWSTAADAKTANVTEKTVVNSNTTLYAVWKYLPVIVDKSITSVEKVITNIDTDKTEIKGIKFAQLQLRAKGGKKQVTLSWKKQKGATSYVIFGSACGTKMTKIKTVSAKTKKTTIKKLKAGKYYKFFVVAVKGDQAIGMSFTAHETTDGGKFGNPTSIKLAKTKVKVKAKKTYKIKASVNSKKKVRTHIAKIRYESSNPSVATVSNKGVIKGLKKGKCTIYVYAQNGICKKISLTVIK